MVRFSVLALGLLLLPAPMAVGAEPRFYVTGSYLMGHPGTMEVDSCGVASRATSSVDSSCAYLPPGLEWTEYQAGAIDESGNSVEIEICFYKERSFLVCGVDLVPPGANYFSVSSRVGVRVHWAFMIE